MLQRDLLSEILTPAGQCCAHGFPMESIAASLLRGRRLQCGELSAVQAQQQDHQIGSVAALLTVLTRLVSGLLLATQVHNAPLPVLPH